MTRGALIFAHNNRDIDYALMSIISGGLVTKHLKVPVSLVTDETTIAWMHTSNIFQRATELFDKIIEVDKPITSNQRRLHDGIENKVVPFVNSNRSSAWDVTPYDRTLLLDSDFLIFSDRLGEYWAVDEDIMIAQSMSDISSQERLGYHDRYVSDTGIHLFWATTVMFTKNNSSRAFFDLVEYVRSNYQYYGNLFRFDIRQYRNDISFSVAKHILNGFETDTTNSVGSDGRLTFLVSSMSNSTFCAAALKDIDVHIMNKQSIIRNASALLELI